MAFTLPLPSQTPLNLLGSINADTLKTQDQGLISLPWMRWLQQLAAATGGSSGSGRPLNIFDYGAVGNGVADDSGAFIAAYGDAVSLGGAAIYCPGGFIYSIQNHVDLSQTVPVKFFGDGPSTVIKRGAAITAGYGTFDITGQWIAFENLLFDGNVTTPVGLTYASFSANPMAASLTTNTSFWVHGGAAQISFFQVYVQHSGGYAVLLDADSDDILNTSLEGCWFLNNRPNLFGTSALDLNYGSWTGGVFYRGDCRSSASKLFAVRNLSVADCHWRRNTGNCLWGHSMGFDTHHENINFVGNDFEDCGLDAILVGNAYSGNVSGNTGHRVGYITRTDSDTPDPAFLAGVYAVFLDSSGYVDAVNYGPNTVTSVNGDAFNLDGVRNCTMNGLQADIPVSGTPQYTEDSIALYGPLQNGVLSGRGIGMGNTSMNGGGYNVTIMNPKITGFGYSAVLLAFAKNCKLIAPLIVHPPGAAEAPIQLYSDNTDPEFYCFGNTVEGATVDYTGAFYAIEETGNGWQPTDVNRIFDTELIGTPAGEFLPDATTLSFSGVTTNQYRLREQSAPAVSASGESLIYMDSTSHIAMISENGGAYQPLAGAGGGYWAASGSDIYNTNAGAVLVYGQDALPITEYGSMVLTGDGAGMVFRLAMGYSATNFFAWLQSSQNGVDYTPLALNSQGGRVVIGTATMPGSPGQRGLFVVGTNGQAAGQFTSADGTGYVESTGGFLSTGANSDTVNIPNGGVTALSLISVRNDGASGLTLVRSSATARTWGLGINSSGQLVLRDETAAASRLTVDTAGLFTFGTTVSINQSGAISASGVITSTGASGGVNVSTSTAYNSIQSSGGGGFLGRNFTATVYTQVGQNSGAPTPTSGDTLNDGCLYYDTGAAALKARIGGSFVTLGSASPAGSTTQVQYNNAGAFGASANFTFNSGTNVLTVLSGMVSTVFNATGTGATITFQNNNSNFSVDGNGNISSAGAVNVTGTNPYRVSGTTIVDASRNATFVALTFGGSSALVQGSTTRIDSSGNGTFVGLTFGGSSALVQGSTTRISTGGNGTFVDLTFGSSSQLIQGSTVRINTTGGFVGVVFNATATGASITFQNNNGNFQVDGNGNLSMAADLNCVGNYKQNGTTVINTSRQFVGAGALCGASGIGAGGFNPWNGASYDTGATGTISILGLTSITVRGGSVTGWA